MKNILITGSAGFIANNLIHDFLKSGYHIYGLDNLSRGTLLNLDRFDNEDRFTFEKCDVSDYNQLNNFLSNFKKGFFSEVWHLAANSDIESGSINFDIDFKDTYLTTFNVLKCMQNFNIRNLFFASSSAIYGDHGESALFEHQTVPMPISNYGAMKLASEAIIYSSFEIFLDKAVIFRFPNVVGYPSTHGVIYDFMHKLKNTPFQLQVLGDGSQKKSYLHVSELIKALIFLSNNIKNSLEIFNIGPSMNDDGITVKEIANLVTKKINPNAKISYGMSNKGWVGDVPKFKFSTDKLASLGWSPDLDSNSSVVKAIDEIYEQFFSKK